MITIFNGRLMGSVKNRDDLPIENNTVGDYYYSETDCGGWHYTETGWVRLENFSGLTPMSQKERFFRVIGFGPGDGATDSALFAVAELSREMPTPEEWESGLKDILDDHGFPV